MISSTQRILAGTLAGAVALVSALAPAAPAAAQYDVANAPGVANVSVTQGAVVIVRGDSGEQVAATINSPLLPGDYISTSGDSRAEVQFDGISMLRLAQDTQVRFVSLDPNAREVQLAEGTAELAQLQNNEGPQQIDTPSVSVRPNQAGDYRVSVLGDGETLVTVRSGSATIITNSGSRTLTPGSTLVATGSYQNPQIGFRGEIAYDAFDTFNRNRDDAIVAAYNSDQYLAPQLAGYTNFSQYGRWSDVPGYGESWAPYNQGNDWSPYSNGQWTWEPGYGYTWVGNEPWGYAPYHYGRWYDYNSQWYWQPPSYQYQTSAASLADTWLPALVGFFLGGGTGAFGPNYNGYIGWVPLAPGEQYTPWYPGFGANAGYPQYGVSNVRYVYNAYRNYRFIRLARLFTFDRFRNGQWNRPILMHPDQLKRIAILRGAVPIVPTKTLMRTGPIALQRTVTISSRFHAQRFASRPIAMHPMTFAKSQAQLESVSRGTPKVVPIAAHPAPVKVTPYRAPSTRTTYHAPVMKPVAPKAATPVRTAVPVHTQPLRTMAPRPRETMVPRPRETMAPNPRETMVPRPRETMAPRPVTAPQPRETMAPRPRETMAPNPRETMAPRPRETMAPRPVTAPQPRETMAPRPRETMAPARPLPEYTRSPVMRETMSPMRQQPPAHSAAPASHYSPPPQRQAEPQQRPQQHQPQQQPSHPANRSTPQSGSQKQPKSKETPPPVR